MYKTNAMLRLFQCTRQIPIEIIAIYQTKIDYSDYSTLGIVLHFDAFAGL